MSIYVCITLTYDIQMLVFYQNVRLKISISKSAIVYFEGTHFHFYPFARTIE